MVSRAAIAISGGSGHSDIVALMVLEHQAQMHNLLTRANHQTRIALRDAAMQLVTAAVASAATVPLVLSKR